MDHNNLIEYLPALEFGITDNCNLKCQSCLHNMPLVKNSNMISLEKFKEQINYLKPFVKIENQIKLSGGEPLLHPDILEFCKILRETWPSATIWIITNGILLKTKDDNFFNTLNNLNIGVEWSKYFNDIEIESILTNKLNCSQVWDKLYMANPGYNFTQPKNKLDSYKADSCFNGSPYKIPFVKDNYIYHCAIDAYANLLEEYFNFKIPNRDINESRLDITKLTKEQIKNFWTHIPTFCSYCFWGTATNAKSNTWALSTKNINEWIEQLPEEFK